MKVSPSNKKYTLFLKTNSFNFHKFINIFINKINNYYSQLAHSLFDITKHLFLISAINAPLLLNPGTSVYLISFAS